ncbi:hypothetical protein [Flammeovirga sp. EKP202]|uniref:hypothetical protein n=1 Tax=Flammeovirga sp. EKP202 TaxID=2770592 RepID=UPI00165F1FA8|nr:hypothetical protein [Flammeovirga sp. EKP202]MBD0401380.1 hypothetical protein [Flammeovirga sp. EKP202]
MQTIYYILFEVLKRWYLWTIPPAIAAVFVYTKTADFKSFESKSKLQFELTSDENLTLNSKSIKLFEYGFLFSDVIEVARLQHVTQRIQLRILKDGVGDKRYFDFEVDENLYGPTEIINRIDFLIEKNKLLDMQRPIDVVILQLLEKNGITPAAVESKIKISRIGSSKYMTITAEDKLAKVAYFYVKVMAEEWTQEYKNEIGHQLTGKRIIIEETTNKSKEELDYLLDSLRNFQERFNVFNVEASSDAVNERILELQKMLGTLTKNHAARRRAIDYIKHQLEVKTDYGYANQNQDLHEQIIHLKDSLQKLKLSREFDQFKADQLPFDHKANLENEISHLESRLQSSLNETIINTTYDPSATKQSIVSDLVVLEIEYEKEEAMIPVVRSQLWEVKSEGKRLVGIISHVDNLKHKINTKEKHYLKLLDKLNVALVLEKDAGKDLFVIEEANFPLKPKSSKRMLLVIGTFMGGLLLIIVTIVATLALDKNLHKPFQFEHETVISTVALVSGRRHKVNKVIQKIPKLNQFIYKRCQKKNKVLDALERDVIKSIRKQVLEIDTKESGIILFNYVRSNKMQYHTVKKLYDFLRVLGVETLILYANWDLPEVDFEDAPIIGNSYADVETATASGMIDLSKYAASPYDYALPSKWFKMLKRLKEQYKYIFILPPPIYQSLEWKEWMDLSSDLYYMYELHFPFNEDDAKNQNEMYESHLNILGTIITEDDEY